ncbi:hypothetical protein LTR70_009411 [Exophiala xenobiotica]|uniref:Uncharacterized protein n=1 Tax=Lithohypha guttulata TaxID=1690604 RepID=A0ABR0JXC1_9EURO|nr:hypothetical protein LTR24_009310 [Lithohypha guttulata]KAK5310548.1 hypothetical protein LTR70_009411 [Exophiala xenobiotica]
MHHWLTACRSAISAPSSGGLPSGHREVSRRDDGALDVILNTSAINDPWSSSLDADVSAATNTSSGSDTTSCSPVVVTNITRTVVYTMTLSHFHPYSHHGHGCSSGRDNCTGVLPQTFRDANLTSSAASDVVVIPALLTANRSFTWSSPSLSAASPISSFVSAATRRGDADACGGKLMWMIISIMREGRVDLDTATDVAFGVRVWDLATPRLPHEVFGDTWRTTVGLVAEGDVARRA